MKDSVEKTETRIEVLEESIDTLQVLQSKIIDTQRDLRKQYKYSSTQYNVAYPGRGETEKASRALRKAIEELLIDKYDDERALERHREAA